MIGGFLGTTSGITDLKDSKLTNSLQPKKAIVVIY